MPEPWLQVLIFGACWVAIILGLLRRKPLHFDDTLGHVAADAHRWSPVGRFFGWIFLLLLGALTIGSIVSMIRSF